MRKNTATIALNGDVSLDDFAIAVGAFSKLMKSLSGQVAKSAKVEWIVESLEISSAIATVRGVSTTDPDDFDSIEDVIEAYERVGRAAQSRRTIPFGPNVRKPVSDLAALLNGQITSLRFETEEFDAEIFSPSIRGAANTTESDVTQGAAQGRVQSMSSRGGLRFTIYDSIDDHAISCYLSPGCEDQMRNAWGRLAIVEGLIRRNPITGLISTVRDIGPHGIVVLEESNPNGWREAVGCAPARTGSISAEDAIRRMRDA